VDRSPEQKHGLSKEADVGPQRRGTFVGPDKNELVFDVCGPAAGPTAVLLHGGGQSRSSWRIAMQQLGEAGYRACAVDLRGHGESEWSPGGDYALERFIEDLLCVIQGIGSPAILIGASYGGQVSLVTAARYPHLVRALILCDVTPWIEGEATKAMRLLMSDASSGFASLTDAARHLDTVSGRKSDRPPESLSKLMRLGEDRRFYWRWDPRFFSTYAELGDGLTEAVSAAAKTLSVPTLLIRAELSEIVTPQQVAAFTKLVPHAVTVQLSGAHHMVTKGDNKMYASIFLEFLRSLSPHHAALRPAT